VLAAVLDMAVFAGALGYSTAPMLAAGHIR